MKVPLVTVSMADRARDSLMLSRIVDIIRGFFLEMLSRFTQISISKMNNSNYTLHKRKLNEKEKKVVDRM